MKVAIVGGGMTGLSAADTLSRHGVECALFEKNPTLGGLAGSFRVGDTYLEKFYHHIFTSDTAIVELVERLGLGHKLEWVPTINSYYRDRIYQLSTPLDLLRFSHVSFLDRIRLGLLYLRTTFIKDWHELEGITAREWLVEMAGERVYEAVWEPLLRGKFGPYADGIAAVWIWNKLKLRGSSRGKRQEERLGYLRGGFAQAIDVWEKRLRGQGVQIETNSPVTHIPVENDRVLGVVAHDELQSADHVVVTTAPEIFLTLAPELPASYRQGLARIKYLANVCLIMELDRSLSDTYWLNIGDPSIPFTGVIEHTNIQEPETYGGTHLTYISRYLKTDNPLYGMAAERLLEEYLPHLKKIYPGFGRSWVKRVWAWREPYTQPVIGLHYSDIRPPFETPLPNLWLSCMAQVYPEDRGMNYAVAYGQQVAEKALKAEPGGR
ncbi:MAG: NAD(P)/FAD-dependent oxidoreductase [Chloroflexota bacterium]|nr:NAD(P)/FAD-dependent oxidoreductase [Chloroflexota bacterium]